jgi:uncharacterized protein YqeY
MAKGEIAANLQRETIAAMKAREKDRLGVLRMLQAAIKQSEVDERRELDADGVSQALAAYAKKVRDQIANARQGGRDDLREQAERELAIVQEFLPAELTDAELGEIIAAAIGETGAAGPRDMGQVMKAVLPRVAGRADGGRVSALVKQRLQNPSG